MQPASQTVVLLVDDDNELRAILELALSGLSTVEVLSASGAEQALAILRIRKIDLLFTDFRMGGMTGLDLLSHIREERLAPTLGSVLMSGEADESLPSRARGAGAMEFWRKPVSPVNLRRFVLMARGDGE